MVIDDGATRTLLVFEAGEAELLVALPPDADLVVVQIDQLADGAVRLAVGHEQDHARPLTCPSLDGVGTHPRLELGTVTSAEFEWRESHPSMKSHQCYYREDALEAIEVHIAGLQADGELAGLRGGAPQLLAVTVAARRYRSQSPRRTTVFGGGSRTVTPSTRANGFAS